jgi:hypothetical protein
MKRFSRKFTETFLKVRPFYEENNIYLILMKRSSLQKGVCKDVAYKKEYVNLRQKSFMRSTHGLNPIPKVVKLFMAVIYEYSYQARVFVLGKPLQSSLIFWVRPGAYPRGKQKCFTRIGSDLSHKH